MKKGDLVTIRSNLVNCDKEFGIIVEESNDLAGHPFYKVYLFRNKIFHKFMRKEFMKYFQITTTTL